MGELHARPQLTLQVLWLTILTWLVNHSRSEMHCFAYTVANRLQNYFDIIIWVMSNQLKLVPLELVKGCEK